MLDVIIIGMGISGITAGIYAKRKGLNVLMFEKNIPGGTLIKLNKINNYPGFDEISGTDLANNLLKQVNHLQVPFKMENVISLTKENNYYKVNTNKGEYLAKNIIIATGRTPKYLGINNEKDYLGKGISTCATCDGYLYKNENVAVVGSGNSALTESLYLSNICNHVYLIHKGNNFNGSDDLIKQISEKSNITTIDNEIVNINETDGKISSITLKNNEIINVKGIFIYIGFRPDSDIFKNLDITNLNGDILVNDNYETALENVYAVGDVIKKDLYQLVTAASDGAKAASKISKN